jgi:hypothetical protein
VGVNKQLWLVIWAKVRFYISLTECFKVTVKTQVYKY